MTRGAPSRNETQGANTMQRSRLGSVTASAREQVLSPGHSKGITIKRFVFTAFGAGVLASTAVGLAGTAAAAPSGPSSVDSTINQLQTQGYQVVVNRIGTAPLDQCTLSAVRPGQTFSRTDSGAPGAGDDVVTTVTGRTVYIDMAC
jgi:hypothetical protein